VVLGVLSSKFSEASRLVWVHTNA